MKKWQIENLETSEISEISEILFRVFLFPSFRFCPTAKIKNSDLKISGKNFRDFRDFRGFYVFDLANTNAINLWTHEITVWTETTNKVNIFAHGWCENSNIVQLQFQRKDLHDEISKKLLFTHSFPKKLPNASTSRHRHNDLLI